MSEVREELAAYAHEAWSRWMKYMFSKSYINGGSVVIPKPLAERWTRQMGTEYEDLPEKEKESDRAEADKILDIARAKTVSVEMDIDTVERGATITGLVIGKL